MSKRAFYDQELEKLTSIFNDVDESKRLLVSGLISDAAFLYAENKQLKEVISKTGMVKVHPDRPELQKSTEAAKQLLKNINSYSVVIRTLNGILDKNNIELDDDDLEDFED